MAGGVLVRGLAWALGRRGLERVVRWVTRFPEHAVQATTDFIGSQYGVEQALSVHHSFGSYPGD